MKDIINWLQTVEHIAGEVYLEAANAFAGDASFFKFLNHLAEEEAWHFHVMGSAANFMASEPNFQPAISIDKETSDKIIKYFLEIRNGIETDTLTKDELLEKIVAAELSEWNDIFTYVVNTLKKKSNEFKYPAARMQSHLKGIEYYLQKIEKKPEILTKISELPPVWIESLLVVEDDPMVASLIKSLLNRDGIIDIVGNGRDALDLLKKNYYKLIISDIDMPIMDGLTFYREAAKIYPNIHMRFLFITGNLSDERVSFFEKNNLQHLSKPMEISELREFAQSTILAN